MTDEEIEKIAKKVLELQKADGVKTTQSLLTFQEVQRRYHKEIYQKAEDEIKELQADINEKNNNGNDTNVGSIGNSIEEDITKINTYVELVLKKDYCNCNELNTILGKHCDGSKNVAYAMQHILSDYKKVLKENEILKEEKEQAWEEWNNLEQGSYETEQKLKQQIKELKKDYYNVINKIENKIDILDIVISECIYIDDDDKAYKKAVKKDKLCLLNQKRALQELLEGGQS